MTRSDRFDTAGDWWASGNWRSALVVVTVCLLGISGAIGPAMASPVAAGDSGTDDPTVVAATDGEAPPDPPSDRIGWENGYWYNESLDVSTDDGLTESELDAVVARTMARVERVRQVEFERTPPVKLVTRDEQQDWAAENLDQFNETERRLLNLQYESLLMIGEDTDAMDSLEAIYGGNVLGFYDPEHRNITMVSPTSDDKQIQENVLSQELFHALQFEQFVDQPDGWVTTERDNARNGVVEGDANYMQYLYEQRCANEWNGTCLQPGGGGSASTPEDLNYGMYQLFLQPYNSGVNFVRQLHREEGWDAVDALYDDLPDSTEQTIHPDAYPEEEPVDLTVEDRSGEAWSPMTLGNDLATESAGEAGLFVSLWLPSYQARADVGLIPLEHHFNVNETTGDFERPVTYSYDHSMSTGWDGDVLRPYVQEDGEETGYVYETAWDSAAEAQEFRDAWVALLEHRGADPVDGRADTYRIPDDMAFGDAFYVDLDGDRVTIVNAPTVDQLSAVREGAAPQSGEPATTGAGDGGADGTGEGSDGGAGDGESTTTGDGTTGGDSPGLGLSVAVLGIVGLVSVLLRRR